MIVSYKRATQRIIFLSNRGGLFYFTIEKLLVYFQESGNTLTRGAIVASAEQSCRTKSRGVELKVTRSRDSSIEIPWHRKCHITSSTCVQRSARGRRVSTRRERLGPKVQHAEKTRGAFYLRLNIFSPLLARDSHFHTSR